MNPYSALTIHTCNHCPHKVQPIVSLWHSFSPSFTNPSHGSFSFNFSAFQHSNLGTKSQPEDGFTNPLQKKKKKDAGSGLIWVMVLFTFESHWNWLSLPVDIWPLLWEPAPSTLRHFRRQGALVKRNNQRRLSNAQEGSWQTNEKEIRKRKNKWVD